VSGGRLGEQFYRTDSRSLEAALAYIIVHYAQQCWDIEEFRV
jgi:hypothetical protein